MHLILKAQFPNLEVVVEGTGFLELALREKDIQELECCLARPA